jgi:uncharacterized membrane protein YfcA
MARKHSQITLLNVLNTYSFKNIRSGRNLFDEAHRTRKSSGWATLFHAKRETPLSLIQTGEIFFIAAAAGIFGSMLGLGGGIILVPALIGFFHIEPRTAVAASVVSVIANSCAGAVSFVRERYANIDLAVLLESTTTCGALAGTFIAFNVSGRTIAGLFSVLLIYAVYVILRPPVAAPPAESENSVLRGSYFDRAAGQDVSYTVVRARLGMAAGFLAGNISALLGVGGGLVIVPVMTSRMGVPLRAAAATSNFMIGVTAVATAILYYAFGAVVPELAAPCVLGVLVGALIGSRLAQRVRLSALRALFAGVLVYSAYAMARRAGIF